MPRHIHFPALLSAVALVGGSATPLLAQARDTRPIYAYAALTPPGDPAPTFRLPALNGDTISVQHLKGHPTILALWSLNCGASRRVLQSVRQLQVDYASRGVAVVLVADDAAEPLRQLLDSAGVPWRTSLPVAVADGQLQHIFDRSRQAPERLTRRVEFALPGFLVLDADGRVAGRSVGVSRDEIRAGDVRLAAIRRMVDSVLASPAKR